MTGRPGGASEGEAHMEIAAAAGTFAAAAERALADGAGVHAEIADVDLARVMSAAVKLYAAKTEALGAGAALPPPVSAGQVTPTEVVVVVSEMLRAVDLSLFDLAMWYRRRG